MRSRPLRRAALAVAAAVALTMPPALAATFGEQARLAALDAAPFDYFGVAVDVDGDTVAIGAFRDDDAALDAGAVHVFTEHDGGWRLEATLTSPDAAPGDEFGWSVALSGDTVVAGARSDDDGGIGSGSAYVFTRKHGTWSFEAKLTASDPNAWDQFGSAVALDHHTAVIGALNDDDPFVAAGSAYVFRRAGGRWVQEAKLTASDPAPRQWFARSVAVEGVTIVVGAPGEDFHDGLTAGAVYVFTRRGGTWVEQVKLTASDGRLDDELGVAVDIAGKRILAGARYESDRGAAYVFERHGHRWAQTQKLVASDAAPYDWFGFRVALTDDHALVLATLHDAAALDAGAVYVFERRRDVFEERAKLIGSGSAALDSYAAVSADDETAVVGAYRSDLAALDSGIAWVFDLEHADNDRE